MLIPGVIGAGGAVITSLAYNAFSGVLPSQLSTGYMPALVQAAAAIGIGMIAEKFLGHATGLAVGIGGLTVVVYNTLSPMIGQATGLQGVTSLGAMRDYVPYARPAMGAYMRNPMLPGRGMGFINPAPTLGAYMRPKMGAYMRMPVPGMMGLGDTSGGSGFNGLNDGM